MKINKVNKNYCSLCPYFFEEECSLKEKDFISKDESYVLAGYLRDEGENYPTLVENLKGYLEQKINSIHLGSLYVRMIVFIPFETTVRELTEVESSILECLSDKTSLGFHFSLTHRKEWSFILTLWIKVNEKRRVKPCLYFRLIITLSYLKGEPMIRRILCIMLSKALPDVPVEVRELWRRVQRDYRINLHDNSNIYSLDGSFPKGKLEGLISTLKLFFLCFRKIFAFGFIFTLFGISGYIMSSITGLFPLIPIQEISFTFIILGVSLSSFFLWVWLISLPYLRS